MTLRFFLKKTAYFKFSFITDLNEVLVHIYELIYVQDFVKVKDCFFVCVCFGSIAG